MVTCLVLVVKAAADWLQYGPIPFPWQEQVEEEH